MPLYNVPLQQQSRQESQENPPAAALGCLCHLLWPLIYTLLPAHRGLGAAGLQPGCSGCISWISMCGGQAAGCQEMGWEEYISPSLCSLPGASKGLNGKKIHLYKLIAYIKLQEGTGFCCTWRKNGSDEQCKMLQSNGDIYFFLLTLCLLLESCPNKISTYVTNFKPFVSNFLRFLQTRNSPMNDTLQRPWLYFNSSSIKRNSKRPWKSEETKVKIERMKLAKRKWIVETALLERDTREKLENVQHLTCLVNC